MTDVAVAEPDTDKAPEPPSAPVSSAPVAAGVVGCLALLSAGAGFLHAAVVEGHRGHGITAQLFAVLAVFQVLWAGLVLVRPSRAVLRVGAGVNLAVVVGYVFSRTTGIPFIDGLQESEPAAFPDLAVTGMEVLLVIVAGMAASGRRLAWPEGRRSAVAVGAVAALIGGLSVPAMAETVQASQAPAGHHDPGTAAGGTTATTAPQAVATAPYLPDKPIDLGGVPGVTPEQQARAENLVAASLTHLPKYADPATAEAAGFRSIRDGSTGYEHYVNRAFMSDGQVLDPDRPESLVYQNVGGRKQLVAAMYMAEPGTTLDTTPELGGALTQWHIHDNLCFGPNGSVAGITNADGTCAPPLVKPEPVPMIHVWIVPNPCGPFAALKGIAGGQIKPGETRLCDTAHGAHA